MAEKKWTYTVENEGVKTRIVDFGSQAFSILGSKSATKKAIAAERIRINGEVPVFSYILKKGDVIELTGSGIHKVKEYNIELERVFEDDHLVIINKPGGIAVNGNRFKTVENAVAGINKNNPEEDALPRPVSVHRIDLPTCGLVMLAKTKSALIKMGKAFQQNKINKEYMAIVHGKPEKQGRIWEDVEGKKAITAFETVHTVPSRVYKHLSLVKLKPVTGRTHQLRIHMKGRNHLIVGDKLYADGEKTILGKGMLLCARKLEFEHPVSGKTVKAEIDPPAKFEKLLQREHDRYTM